MLFSIFVPPDSIVAVDMNAFPLQSVFKGAFLCHFVFRVSAQMVESNLSHLTSVAVSEAKKLLSMISFLVVNTSHKSLCMHFERYRRKEGPKDGLYEECIRTVALGSETIAPTGIAVIAQASRAVTR